MLSLSDDCSLPQRIYLWLIVFASVGSTKGKFEVSSSKHGGLSLSAPKGDNRPAHEKQAPDFTVRYVVAMFCHYQYNTVVVLESLAIRSRRLLSFE